MKYELIRSSRRTLALEMKPDGRLIVRAPRFMPKAVIERFVSEKSEWIEEKQRMFSERKRNAAELTGEDVDRLRKEAKRVLPEKTAFYAERMGLSMPGRITITSARTRYGSCSAKNTISYSLFLMANPEEAVDYVVVHELAHMRQKNHSRAFYDEIAKVLPDWKRRRSMLRMPEIPEE